MQYSPKLKTAAKEIDEILKKHDIGAFVVLHTPGHSEYLMNIDPSYSCAKWEENGLLKLRAKAEDFGGDKEMLNKKLTETSNMLSLLCHTSNNVISQLEIISKTLDYAIKATHFDTGPSTSHIEQNN